MENFKRYKNIWINSYRWQEEGLVVWVYNHDLPYLMEEFKDCNTLFCDGGVEARVSLYTVCIPHFERMLEYLGFSEQEIDEMFDNLI